MCANILDLVNVFESFLPQLLTYPNPIDPLNGEAASLYLHKPDEYKKKVAGKRARHCACRLSADYSLSSRVCAGSVRLGLRFVWPSHLGLRQARLPRTHLGSRPLRVAATPRALLSGACSVKATRSHFGGGGSFAVRGAQAGSHG